MCKLPSTNNGLCELWEYSHGKTYQQDFILTDVYSNIEWKKVSLINNHFFFNSTDTKSVSVVIGLSFWFCAVIFMTDYSRTFYISLLEVDASIVSPCTAVSFVNWFLLSSLWQVKWQSSICFQKVKHCTVWRWVETLFCPSSKYEFHLLIKTMFWSMFFSLSWNKESRLSEWMNEWVRHFESFCNGFQLFSVGRLCFFLCDFSE